MPWTYRITDTAKLRGLRHRSEQCQCQQWKYCGCGLERFIKRYQMSFKPRKSMSLALKIGWITTQICFSPEGSKLLSATDKPSKSPGMTNDSILREVASFKLPLKCKLGEKSSWKLMIWLQARSVKCFSKVQE